MYNNPYMNPQMFSQYKDQLKGENAAKMTEQMKNMSDDDLRRMGQMSGMNMDPSMMRMAFDQFSRMSDKERENLADMASNMQQNRAQTSTPSRSSSATSNSSPTAAPSAATSQFPVVTKLKDKGNDAFKNQKLDDAASSYFEGILEIEEIQAKPNYPTMEESRKNELRTLEVTLRNNYATVKAKQGEFTFVKDQAQKVLQLEPDNAKAQFRLGQALSHFKKYESALPYLEKAKKTLTSDAQVKELYETAKKEVEKQKQAEASASKATTSQEPPKNDTSASTSPQPAKKVSSAAASEFGLDEEEVKRLREQREKRKREEEAKLLTKSSAPPANDAPRKSEDVVIEEEKEIPRTVQASAPVTSTSTSSVPRSGIDPSVIEKSKEEMSKMSKEELQQRLQFIKGMDKGFFKNMYKQQFGMDLDDAQIDMMMNMMTPEMLQQAAKMDMSQAPPMPGATLNSSSSSASKTPSTSASPSTPSFDSAQVQSLLGNEQMMNTMMDQLKNNPAMLKSMAGMLGENHPLGGYLNRASPEDLQKLVKTFQRFQPLLKYGMRAYTFFKKYKYVIGGLFAAWVIYYFFGGMFGPKKDDEENKPYDF